MNNWQRWTPVLLLTIFFAVQATGSRAETRSVAIGVAQTVQPNAEGGSGTAFQTLAPGTELHANETVRTGNAGKADLMFIDRTNLTVGPTSEVVLDKFVYDPVGSSGKVVMQTTRGAFRFVTGTQDHRAYQLNTPYGSLGVRGTIVKVEVQPKGKKRRIAGCDVTVTVEQGEAEFTTLGGKKKRIRQGETACVQGENVSLTQAEGPNAAPGLGGNGPPGGGGPGGPGITPPPCVSPTRLGGCS
jgi:quercetin dioxygenase-like cupin family protein